MPREVEVLVVGGGQAGLAVGFYLRRAGYRAAEDYLILDASPVPGGAWARMWSSLRAFSPPEYSSLPGWMMPPWHGDDGFPPTAHVRDYLAAYERRYDLPVHRPSVVRRVSAAGPAAGDPLLVETDGEPFLARTVVSATGTWTRPFVPAYPGATEFRGRQLHPAQYRSPEELAGRRVVVVGGGNTAAQLLAEVSLVASTTWVTLRPPRFLPDEVDGRELFRVATRRRRALEAGEADSGGVASLGDVVMVPSVRAARERGVLHAEPMFARLTATGVAWADGRTAEADTVLWCTGFRPELRHLAALHLRTENGHVACDGTRARSEPRLHLVGYGDWTGLASATLIGVGRTARDLVASLQRS